MNDDARRREQLIIDQKHGVPRHWALSTDI
jgi:hypothetical protein